MSPARRRWIAWWPRRPRSSAACTERTPGLLAARAKELGIAADEVESRDFAADSPRGNAICRMVDAAEIAYLAVFLASDKAWAVSGELVVATGGAGRSVYY